MHSVQEVLVGVGVKFRGLGDCVKILWGRLGGPLSW